MKYLKWLNKNMQSLSGKKIIVSGANSGIGYYASVYLSYLGAEIIFACRNKKRAEDAMQLLKNEVPSAIVSFAELDLSSAISIKNFVTDIKERFKTVDGLINNAGVYFPSSPKSADGLEMTIGTNYIGTYLLTTTMLKENLFAPNATIDIVTSLTDKHSKFDATDFFNQKSANRNVSYGRSKLYLTAFTYYLAQEIKQSGMQLKIVSSHPGVSATNILSPTKTGFSKCFAKAGSNFLKLFTHSPQKACLTSVYSFSNKIQNGDRIGPRGLFEISGLPKKSKYPKKAKRIYKHLMQKTQEIVTTLPN